jgi:hypothetical protein
MERAGADLIAHCLDPDRPALRKRWSRRRSSIPRRRRRRASGCTGIGKLGKALAQGAAR